MTIINATNNSTTYLLSKTNKSTQTRGACSKVQLGKLDVNLEFFFFSCSLIFSGINRILENNYAGRFTLQRVSTDLQVVYFVYAISQRLPVMDNVPQVHDLQGYTPVTGHDQSPVHRAERPFAQHLFQNDSLSVARRGVWKTRTHINVTLQERKKKRDRRVLNAKIPVVLSRNSIFFSSLRGIRSDGTSICARTGPACLLIQLPIITTSCATRTWDRTFSISL